MSARTDMTPEAAGAWKQATYNQYAVPAIEESSRYKTSVLAVFGLVGLGVALQTFGVIENLGSLLLLGIAVLAVGPAAAQVIRAVRGSAPLN